MDIEWRMTDDVLAKIRSEMRRSRPEDLGRLLKPMGEFHIATVARKASCDVDLFVDTAIELLRPASLFERMAFANLLADAGRVPSRLLDVLLRDVYLVSRPLIERAQISDGDLVAVMATDTSESTLLAIAERRGTGIPVTDRLIEAGTLKVHLTLAANDGATLSMAGFDRFSNMTSAQNDMDLALAQRSDLPVSIAKALYQRLSDRSAKRVADLMERDRNRGRRALALGSR